MELFMKEKIFSLHGEHHIYDLEGNECYEVRGKFFSIHDYMSLYDTEGKELAKIHKKLISLHETHFIEIDGKEVTELRTKLFHPFNQEIDMPEIGWESPGQLLRARLLYLRQRRQPPGGAPPQVHLPGVRATRLPSPPTRTWCWCWPSSWPWSAFMKDRDAARQSGAIAAGATVTAHANQQEDNDQN